MLPIQPLLMRNASTSGTAGYLSGENLPEQTFTGASTDPVTLSGSTLKASTDYYIFASADIMANNTVSDARLDVLNGATQLNIMRPQYQTSSVGTDYRNLHYVGRVTTSATPSSDSWILRLSQDAGSGSTITWKNARLVMLEVGANDAHASSVGHQFWTNPTNETSQTVTSLTFTGSGDYLILAYCIVDKIINTNTVAALELTDGTTTTGEQWVAAFQTSDRIPVTLALYPTGLAGSKTYTLKMREVQSGSTVIGVGDARIIAIKLSRFANVYSDNASSSANASTSYVATAADVTFTPAAAAHLTIAAGMFNIPSLSAVAGARYDDGGTIVAEQAFLSSTALSDNAPFMAARIANYTATSRRQKIDHKASAGTVTTWRPFIFTFDLTGI